MWVSDFLTYVDSRTFFSLNIVYRYTAFLVLRGRVLEMGEDNSEGIYGAEYRNKFRRSERVSILNKILPRKERWIYLLERDVREWMVVPSRRQKVKVL